MVSEISPIYSNRCSVDNGTPLVSDIDFSDRFFSNRRSWQFLDRRLKMSSVDISSNIHFIIYNNYNIGCYIK